LAYLTKNSLIGWYREYERDRELQVGYVRSSGKYTTKKKDQTVLCMSQYSGRMQTLDARSAADFASSLNRQFLDLTAQLLGKLCHTPRHYSRGDAYTCETIQSCWNGVRLDLGRDCSSNKKAVLRRLFAFLC
jgi:hypothetical protein